MRLPSWAMSAIMTILQTIFGMFSDSLKKALVDAIRGLYVKALSSTNPFDDFGVTVLATLLGISLDGVVPEPKAAHDPEPINMSEEMKTMLLSGMNMVSTDGTYPQPSEVKPEEPEEEDRGA